MKVVSGFLWGSCWLLLSGHAEAQGCDANCQLSQINGYFKALDQVSRKGSGVQEIEQLLGQLHPEVKYIHVEYDAQFDAESWRKAFQRNLARGAYQNSPQQEQRVLKTIFGKNHVAVEYAHGVIQPDGRWQSESPLLVLFGFTDGKISLVKELW